MEAPPPGTLVASKRLRSLALLGCAVLAGVAATRSERAHACLAVAQYVAAPVSDALIPGNLVFFRVLNEGQGVELALIDVESGATLPSSIVTRAGDRLLMPDAPVAAGRHLALVEKRSAPDGGALEIARHPFTTTEHVELRLQKANLSVVANHGNRVELRYTSPDASGKARHLLELSATLDGQPYFSAGAAPDTFELSSTCDGLASETSCGNILSVSEGGHELEVQAHILGSAVQPETVRASVEISCGEGCSTARGGASAGSALMPMLLGLLLLRAQRPRKAR